MVSPPDIPNSLPTMEIIIRCKGKKTTRCTIMDMTDEKYSAIIEAITETANKFEKKKDGEDRGFDYIG